MVVPEFDSREIRLRLAQSLALFPLGPLVVFGDNIDRLANVFEEDRRRIGERMACRANVLLSPPGRTTRKSTAKWRPSLVFNQHFRRTLSSILWMLTALGNRVVGLYTTPVPDRSQNNGNFPAPSRYYVLLATSTPSSRSPVNPWASAL